MSAFINLDTMEYPRYQGDLDLNPEANWAEVNLSDAPNLLENQIAYEIEPELIDGLWYQKWSVRYLSEEEITKNATLALEYYEKMGMPKEDIGRLMGA